MTYKFTQNISSIIKIIDVLLDKYGEELAEEIAQSFSDIIYDLDPSNNEDEAEYLSVAEVIESQTELIKSLLYKIYFLKKYL